MARGVRNYDVVVIGSGSGMTIVEAAVGRGLHVALVDKGALGGTCANTGCIPSKMLIAPADRVMEMREAHKLGIQAEVQAIDFQAIMGRMRRLRDEGQRQMREGVEQTPNLDYFPIEGQFIGERTLQVGKRQISGERVYIVAGARPAIPPVPGLAELDYLTSETVFDIPELPESLVIVGGGYVACEFAHFFAAMGSQVTLVQRNQRLVPDEEPEISELLQSKLAERMAVVTNTEAVAARREEGRCIVQGRDRKSGALREFSGQRVLVAAGRASNADLLQVDKAGIAVDVRGFIVANEYLETNVSKVWAFGDVIGKYMFKHVANREAVIAWHNSQHDHKAAMDYRAMPHAVFTHPQIASVGLSEAEARRTHKKVLVGRAHYTAVAMGLALVEREGFAKAVIDAENEHILGFHIIGPQAAILIQEVINLMAEDAEFGSISRGLHIHPALSELVESALNNLR